MKFNEFFIGQTFHTASLTLTRDHIMCFAAEYDPQYMHLDETKAAAGRFKGLIASGIQTMAVSFKLWVETGIYGEEVVAGTGMDHIRFIKPVYPNDELHVEVEVIRLEPRRRSGIVTVRLSTFNAANEKVFTGELSALVEV
ncbi:MaoC family dehydratase [Saccharibacillus sp. CPCC 101409]|uniref:MaoC family dehydratase n=1 Tax=Saccharibacillus sp. CPCC 101409 TaxID=3058041 RepID=UPI002671EF54|nr:MaoC family dehydratase [Saccharibacillus sp. CPCC 101409]MDO3411940.1 MaoC family dehydratase [Saccharibacillus sp. CPCC 101409]